LKNLFKNSLKKNFKNLKKEKKVFQQQKNNSHFFIQNNTLRKYTINEIF